MQLVVCSCAANKYGRTANVSVVAGRDHLGGEQLAIDGRGGCTAVLTPGSRAAPDLGHSPPQARLHHYSQCVVLLDGCHQEGNAFFAGPTCTDDGPSGEHGHASEFATSATAGARASSSATPGAAPVEEAVLGNGGMAARRPPSGLDQEDGCSDRPDQCFAIVAVAAGGSDEPAD